MRVFVSLVVLALGSSFVYAQQPAPAQEEAQQPVAETQPVEQEPARHIALRVVGSHVHSPGGYRLGRIEEVLANPTNGAIAFAVLAPSFPTNDSRRIPLPWSSLTYAWDQSQAGGPTGANQIFIANIAPEQLAKAPTLQRNRTSGIDPALVMANHYFGAGGAGTGSTTVSGTGSGQPVAIAPVAGAATTAVPAATEGTGNANVEGQPLYAVPGGSAGEILNTNGITRVPTNSSPTNPDSTNVVGAPTNGVTFQPGSGPPFTPFPGPGPARNVDPNPQLPGAGVGVVPPQRRPTSPRSVQQTRPLSPRRGAAADGRPER